MSGDLVGEARYGLKVKKLLRGGFAGRSWLVAKELNSLGGPLVSTRVLGFVEASIDWLREVVSIPALAERLGVPPSISAGSSFTLHQKIAK